MAKDEGMVAYTEWWCKYPWHVSDQPVPDDCDCKYCTAERAKKNSLSIGANPINKEV